MATQNFLDAKEEELLKIANGCLNKAGSAVSGPSSVKADLTKLRLFLEAQLCLSEVIRKRADQAAQRDRDRENRHFWIEIIVVAILIAAELGVSIYYGRLGVREGKEQAVILDQMNKNTEATAAQIQKAADAITATLQVLQADRADRLAQAAKKPHLVLYVGHTPLAKVNGPLRPSQETGGNVIVDLVLGNVGDAPADNLTLRAHVPGKNVWLNPGPTWAAADDLPDNPGRTFLCHPGSLRPKNYIRITTAVSAPDGTPPFQINFNADADEIGSDTPLGVLTITPRNSAGQSTPPAPPKL